jgi:hypothetical protein
MIDLASHLTMLLGVCLIVTGLLNHLRSNQ